MEKLFSGLVLIIAIPIALGISWAAGSFFRTSVLKHEVDGGNKFIQTFFSIIIGMFLFAIITVAMNKMGCSTEDDAYTR